MSRKIFDHVALTTLKGQAVHQLLQGAAGCSEVATLRLASDVVDREPIIVGGVVHEIVVVNTDTGSNSSVLDSTDDVDVVETITAHGLVKGDVVRCEAEFLTVVSVEGVNTVKLSRGAYGSTIASHADGTDIFKKEATALTAGAKKLPTSGTLTPAAAGPQIAAAFNYHKPSGFSAEYNANEVFFWRDAGDSAVAFSEVLTGTNNVVDAASHDGVAKGEAKAAWSCRVPTATEVALGALRFQFPFTVKFTRVSVRVTASGAVVAWDGATTVSGGRVTLGNGGSVDWSVNDTVTVEVFG